MRVNARWVTSSRRCPPPASATSRRVVLLPMSMQPRIKPPASPEILAMIQRMGELVRSQVIQCKQAFERRDVALAQDLVRQDDEVDRLNKEVFRHALEQGDDPDRREWGMYMMLVGRCLERIGDNAVDVGEQTAFVVTGLFREFEDASHPELAPGLQP